MAAEIEAMRPGAEPVPLPQLRSDNLSYIDPTQWTPEESALIAKLLRGAARVFEARARGEV